MPSPWRRAFSEQKSLPAEVSPPPVTTLQRGQVLRRGQVYLRVVKVEGKRVQCQTRTGSSGRFSEEARFFDLAALLKLYKVV